MRNNPNVVIQMNTNQINMNQINMNQININLNNMFLSLTNKYIICLFVS